MILPTDEMVAAANAVVPALTPETVRRMLEAAMLQQFVLSDGKREEQAKERPGKSQYALCLQINRLMAGDGELSN